jgi:hypothetical protein
MAFLAEIDPLREVTGVLFVDVVEIKWFSRYPALLAGIRAG